MRLKAMLVCEDVRFEVGGTVSLVGVVNERIVVPPGDGAIVVARFVSFAVVAGLRGVERLTFRQWLRGPGLGDEPTEPASEPHEPRSDEHNFVFALSPMVFPEVGTYELGLAVDTGRERDQYTIGFAVERARGMRP